MGVQGQKQCVQHIQHLISNTDELLNKHSECCMYYIKALGLWSYAIYMFLLS